MSKKEYFLTLEVAILYFSILSLLHFRFTVSLEIVIFFLGGIFGTFLLDLDYFLYVFYTRPDFPVSFSARELLTQKKYREMISFVLGHTSQYKELILHSAIFGPVLFVFTLFVLTSSGSFLGAGLALGVFLRYLLDLRAWYLQGPVVLQERFFWQIRGIVDLRAQKIFLSLLLLGFIFLSLLFIS